MKFTRRQFTQAAASTVALTILGCDQSSTGPADGEANNAPADGGEESQPATDTAVATDESDKRASKKARLANEPFLAGAIEQYRGPGVYGNFKTFDPLDDANKGVWLVSDGVHLIALAAMCTHNFCTTDWNEDTRLFKCPCHKSEFDELGINQEGGKAKRPLDRCKIKIVDTPTGPQVQVDPTDRPRFDREQEVWDGPECKLAFTNQD